ncbi:tRNA (adenosine(37)-N6)-dimethylallyltransferase MiaA [Trueperella pyogenes]|uniref:tRNA (adenosine(37)-N6)-dimethylallyltransferase MiaA n=1 Tax=Trueperella pyogenes TaxID=1661 RepID=UPI000C1B6811|nr:tRNA (adenosine(37)-N6)-dimethylallyltransferase MiaA [Trueperella pyogenes]PIN51750.1 tRNA (adenosine(37)-N6)-dimethylallyltransferase MiaA [Trueperella pyogenes]
MSIIAVLGSTAAGKSALSLELAELLGGPERVEIVSADAMQLYRGMDIGTAKLSPEERRGITHHQLDVLDVTDVASVAAYQRHARADLNDIRGRGKIAMVVGGSGLYVSGLLDELNFPGTDATIRRELESIHEAEGLGPLIAELRERDPVTANTINLRNPRRVIRALEVVRLTGTSYTPVFPRHTSHYDDVVMIGVRRAREVLNQAIGRRAACMFADGLVEETRSLLEAGLREGETARKATGYAEAIAVIDGKMSEAEAIDSVALATRRLAKKQRTWFGRDPRITWIDADGPALVAAAYDVVRG